MKEVVSWEAGVFGDGQTDRLMDKQTDIAGGCRVIFATENHDSFRVCDGLVVVDPFDSNVNQSQNPWIFDFEFRLDFTYIMLQLPLKLK